MHILLIDALYVPKYSTFYSLVILEIEMSPVSQYTALSRIQAATYSTRYCSIALRTVCM
jgi:hypothetical protein